MLLMAGYGFKRTLGKGLRGAWGGGRRAQRRDYTSYRPRVAWRLKLDQGRSIPRFVLKSVAAGGGRKR